jgi:hypothetical protein
MGFMQQIPPNIPTNLQNRQVSASSNQMADIQANQNKNFKA